MQPDGDIAHGLGDLDRHDLVGRGRLGVAEIGRAEEAHGPAGQRLEQALGGVDLERDEGVGHLAEIWMGEGVVAHVVALGQHTLHERGISLRVVADDEEAGMDALVFQDVEDLRRPVGVGTVVEGQCELAGLVAGPLDDIGGRHGLVGLIVDVARVLVDLEGPLAGRRLLGHAQNLAFTLEIDVLAGADHAQAVGRGRVVGAAEHRPDRRVLGAEPPQRIARRTIGVG